MSDRYREAATLYQDALDADHRTSMDAAITIIAAALSAAHEAGRREEREAVERTLTSIRARSAYHPDETLDDLKRQMRHINSVSDAAIRIREVKP